MKLSTKKRLRRLKTALIKSCIIVGILLPSLAIIVKCQSNKIDSIESNSNDINFATSDTEDVPTHSYECCNPIYLQDYNEEQLQLLQAIQETNFYDKWNIPIYDESLVTSVAKVITIEAGGVNNDYWQQLVGYVLLNRLASTSFPNTIEEILNDGYAEETIEKYKNDYFTEQAFKNAEIVVSNYYNDTIPVPKNLVYQAEFPQGENWYHIGNTYFGVNPKLPD